MKKKLLVALGVILAVLLMGPFLVPVPPLTDTLPVQQLADDDSLFMDFRGFAVHYKQWGEGIAGAVLEVFDHCGHLPQEEYPGDFAWAVREFLTGTIR